MNEQAKVNEKPEIPPIHQWTHDGQCVLLVKCLNRDGTSHGGFIWPRSGIVKPDKWSREPDCDSGGLFGWAWGLWIGDGRDPDACSEWIVFAASPENVIAIGAKAKAVPSEDGKTFPEVVYRGTQAGALYFTMAGRLAWIQARANGSASATGESGSASATGWSGSASATGWSGSASATGESGSASATGESGSASATGGIGSASATGESGSASATGESGSASATGERGSASATGWSGSASATGESGSASVTGERGSASATGERGSASATGESGSASATGGSGSASATGERNIAVVTGIEGTVEVGQDGIAAAWGDRVTWKIIKGAVLIQRWEEDGKYPFAVLDSSKLKTGDIVTVVKGKIQK